MRTNSVVFSISRSRTGTLTAKPGPLLPSISATCLFLTHLPHPNPLKLSQVNPPHDPRCCLSQADEDAVICPKKLGQKQLHRDHRACAKDVRSLKGGSHPVRRGRSASSVVDDFTSHPHNLTGRFGQYREKQGKCLRIRRPTNSAHSRTCLHWLGRRATQEIRLNIKPRDRPSRLPGFGADRGAGGEPNCAGWLALLQAPPLCQSSASGP